MAKFNKAMDVIIFGRPHLAYEDTSGCIKFMKRMNEFRRKLRVTLAKNESNKTALMKKLYSDEPDREMYIKNGEVGSLISGAVVRFIGKHDIPDGYIIICSEKIQWHSC